MQYTLRKIPPELDKALRRRAKEEGKSLNDAAVEALQRGIGAARKAVRLRNLRGIAGTWVEDPDFNSAIAEQDRIDGVRS